MHPLVTIVTPSLQQGSFLEDNLRSVLEQDYPRLEQWVIDGGSTDGSLELLRSYAGRFPERLRWTTGPDSGQSDAINKGLRRASGDILAWLNADDVFYPGAVRRMVDLFTRCPETEVAYGKGCLIDRGGNFLREFPHNAPFDAKKLLDGYAYILQPTVFWRRRVMEKVGYLDTSLHYGMDFDYWCRMARAGCRFQYDESRFVAAARYYRETKTMSGNWQRFRELARVARRHSPRLLPAITLFTFLDALMATAPPFVRGPLHAAYRIRAKWRNGRASDYGEMRPPFTRGPSLVHFPWYRPASFLHLDVELRDLRASVLLVSAGRSLPTEHPLAGPITRLRIPWRKECDEIVLNLCVRPADRFYRVGRVRVEP